MARHEIDFDRTAEWAELRTRYLRPRPAAAGASASSSVIPLGPAAMPNGLWRYGALLPFSGDRRGP